jgi:chromosome segregation ATPase
VNAAFDTADALYRPVIRDRAADLEAYLAEADARLAAISTAHAALREKYRVSKEKLASKSAESTSLKEQLRQYERSAGGKLNRLLRRVKPNPSRKDAPSNGT